MPKATTRQNQPLSTHRPPYPAPSVALSSTSMAGTCPASSDRRTATPWNSSDDKRLIDARQKGLSWKHIAPEHFPDKTANACRKRHERLVDKRNNQDNWDGQKFENMARAYYENREKLWRILAEPLNERWEDVERKCIEKGLKTVKNTGQTLSRRDKNDDSGPILDCDSSRPCSEIGRDEHHSYSRSQNNDQSLGSFKTMISSNQGQIYNKPYSSQRDDRNSTTPYPSRFSPTSTVTSFSKTSPSNQPQQLPRLNQLGIQSDLPNGLPGVAQMLLPSVSTH